MVHGGGNEFVAAFFRVFHKQVSTNP